MGNVGSNSFHRRRRHGGESSSRDGRQQITTNQRVYAAAYTSQYPNLPPPHTPYYKHEKGARYPPPPLPAVTSPESPDDHHRMAMDRALEAWVDGSYPPLHVDRQTVTITNNINIKKETFKIEPDEEHPGKFLVSFTFDATVPCSITLYFFAKEWKNGSLTAIKDESPPPLTLSFEKGLRQMFQQKPGTGVDLSMFDEAELSEGNETSVYPLALEAEGSVTNYAQITYAAFEKYIIKGEFEYKVRVVKQIFRVEGVRYDLQEIYGDDGKECVICLSEPQDTAVLPCCHMCMCNVCANVLRFQTSVQCPICRKPIERLLEIKVKSGV